MNTNEAGKTTFLFLRLSRSSRLKRGNKGRVRERSEEKKKWKRGRNVLIQSSRLQGNEFPKVPNQGPSSAIFPLLFPSRRCNQFVITLCMPRHSRQPYNLQLWGLLGGRDGGRVRKRERGGAWSEGGRVLKKSQEAASSGRKKNAQTALVFVFIHSSKA